MKYLIIFSCIIFITKAAFTQGDDCANATYLSDVTDFCSPDAFYTNVGSTASGFATASCWTATSTEDVWFTFIATGTDVLVSVGGVGDGGTLNQPRIAIYYGDCSGTINELACANNTASGITQLYEGGMTPGTSYLIRISTRPVGEGTFNLCVNNYTPAAAPGADCSGSTFLCAKSTIGVATLNGGGADANEPDGDAGSCMTGSFFSDAETNSVWYNWTCGTSGSLTFDITPVDPANDIDYVLYQLSGPDPCGVRTIVRCNTSSCLNANGSTGINISSVDFTEDSGCDIGEDAYCQSINMVAGSSYALLINNASTSSGFNLSWGGSGTFTGPTPIITNSDDNICAGTSIDFNGSSSTNVSGGLTWVFSDGITIQNQNGSGPFTIPYATPGNYVAILTGTDATGCQETDVVNITVNNCSSCTVTAGNNGSICPGETVNLTATDVPNATFSWTGPNGFINNNQNPSNISPPLTPGNYIYTVTATLNGSPCTSSTTVVVNSLPIVSAGSYSSVCVNASNVSLVGTPAGGSFSGTGVSGNSFDPSLGTQTITYTYTDGNSCTNSATASITVNNLPVVNAGSYANVCIDAPDVSLLGNPLGGTFSGTGVVGLSFDPSVGTQVITYNYTDGNNCANSATVTINVNQLPIIDAGTDLTICAGTALTLLATGGVTYTWSNGIINGQETIPAVGVNSYTVTGTDANGCLNTDLITLTVLDEPVAILSADINTGLPILTVNFSNSSLNATNYTWDFGNGTNLTITNQNNQTSMYLVPGTYNVILTASNGVCEDQDQLPIIVIPFPDPIINVPNVFSPNNDASNDEYFIYTENVSNIELIILNRWGSVVYETKDLNGKWNGQWNGKDASEGVYFFKYVITDLNGKVLEGHGNVTLLR